jgi:hypothetical protein
MATMAKPIPPDPHADETVEEMVARWNDPRTPRVSQNLIDRMQSEFLVQINHPPGVDPMAPIREKYGALIDEARRAREAREKK